MSVYVAQNWVATGIILPNFPILLLDNQKTFFFRKVAALGCLYSCTLTVTVALRYEWVRQVRFSTPKVLTKQTILCMLVYNCIKRTFCWLGFLSSLKAYLDIGLQATFPLGLHFMACLTLTIMFMFSFTGLKESVKVKWNRTARKRKFNGGSGAYFLFAGNDLWLLTIMLSSFDIPRWILP